MNRLLNTTAAVLLTLLLIVLSGCQTSDSAGAEGQTPFPSPAGLPPVTADSNPAGSPAVGSFPSCAERSAEATGGGPEGFTPGDTVKKEQVVPLNWNRVEERPFLAAAMGLPVGAQVVSENRLEAFGGIRVTVYTIDGDEDYVYADLHTAAGDFSLGSIGTYNNRNAGNTTAEETCLFTGSVLKITGGVGASSSLSNYYTIDADGKPAGLLQINTGHAREVDIDGDGYWEAAAAHGLPMTAYIYRWSNGYAEYSYLNEVLDADSVVLREDLVVEASTAGEMNTSEYRLTPDGLIPAAAVPEAR